VRGAVVCDGGRRKEAIIRTQRLVVVDDLYLPVLTDMRRVTQLGRKMH
jgi:hypothetical protein